MVERDGSYDLFEFNSSRLTNIHKHNVMPGSLFGFNADRSFGLLAFDTTVEDPQVRYSIVTVENEVVWEFVLRRSELRHAAE